MLTLEIDASGVKQVTDALKGSLSDFTPEMRQVQQQMARSVEITFRQKGRPGRWQELSPATVTRRQQRARRGGRRAVAGDATQLRDTDALRRSVTDTTGSAPGSASYVNGKEAVVGTSLPQAPIQQRGGTVTSESGRSITIPARAFLQILPEDARRYEEIATRGLARRVKEATRG